MAREHCAERPDVEILLAGFRLLAWQNSALVLAQVRPMYTLDKTQHTRKFDQPRLLSMQKEDGVLD